MNEQDEKEWSNYIAKVILSNWDYFINEINIKIILDNDEDKEKYYENQEYSYISEQTVREYLVYGKVYSGR